MRRGVRVRFRETCRTTEKSALFLALNLNKFDITLDLSLPEDRRRLTKLTHTAGVVVGHAADFGTDCRTLRRKIPA